MSTKLRHNRTYSAKPDEVERRWFVIDASDQILGRLATRVASVIRGKHKPHFTLHEDVGDFVVVINAAKVKLTGNKLDKKQFRRHTGYPGGLVEIPYRRLLETHPERAIQSAVQGMLPKGRLGRQLRNKLKVYPGAEHPHSSQKPEELTVAGPIPVHVGAPPARKIKPKKEKKAPATAAKKGAPKKSSPSKSSGKKKPTARKSTAKAKPAASKTETKEES
jgi:large subunit ribosomal protein L13